jgi:IS605 OrfB family transposase
LSEKMWEQKSPLLFLHARSAELHFPQTKGIAERLVKESKLDPDLVTVAVDLNVKNLAVITVRQHVHRMNEDAAHQVAHSIASVCARYPGCVLLFERLRKIRAKGGGKSRRINRKQANQLRGKINQQAREKAFVEGVVTVEVNPHGTSHYCSRCGLKGERFSLRGGKLFWCPHCRYEAHADWNGSVNVHHSFFHELHWQPRRTKSA